MRTGEPYPIKALMVFGGNPLVTVANARDVHESLLHLDLLVVTDMFMTPTAALADYVLPAAFWPEVNQTIELPFVAENAVLAQQKVVQVGQCRQDEEILIDLARRLNLPGSDDNLEDILNYRLEPTGLTFEELKSRSIVYPPHEYRKFEKNGFRTPSRKVELYCKALERLGYDPLPAYSEPPESPTSQPEMATKFPYVLTTGSRRIEYFHSEHRQVESLRKRRPYPTVEIHPEIADQRGIRNGDWTYVSSPRGRIKMKAVVTEDISKGVVNIDHGWWFPEKSGPDFGVWESNANLLTSNQPPYDPAFGSYQLRGLLCNVERFD
jgi:anaerobic selenocysteine-containing dehydrogenase